MDNKVLDEAVEVALETYFKGFSHRNETGVFYPEGTHEAAMRAALLASLPVLLGEVAEVVGEMTDYIDQEVDPELDVVERWRDQMHSYLNAPSLGEGDGR